MASYVTTLKQEEEIRAILTQAHQDHEKSLKRYSFLKVNDRALSEDLVQETFLKTWKYLVKGGKVELMKAFLSHVLNDLIVDEYRKHKPVSLDILLAKGYEPRAINAENNFNIMDGKTATLLIQELPEKYQKVMHMRYVRDLSIKEIALITEQSKNATAVQLHRGLEKLKLLYDPPSDK